MESSIDARSISDRLAALSERQREVVILVCRGLSNRLIADTLGVSEGTIKGHLHTIFEKLDVQSRIELMILLSNPKVMQPAA
jgi:RNA polymerase sigma factor (sigma-70 family)